MVRRAKSPRASTAGQWGGLDRRYDAAIRTLDVHLGARGAGVVEVTSAQLLGRIAAQRINDRWAAFTKASAYYAIARGSAFAALDKARRTLRTRLMPPY